MSLQISIFIFGLSTVVILINLNSRLSDKFPAPVIYLLLTKINLKGSLKLSVAVYPCFALRIHDKIKSALFPGGSFGTSIRL